MPKKKNSEKVKQGKKNRAGGARFEAKVRANLESLGWIVSKWMNTVEQEKDGGIWKLVPAKPKFVFNSKIKRMLPMGIGTGFPDFVCFKKNGDSYEVIGVEVKVNGYVDKKERPMLEWMANHIFSRVLIAKKGKKRGEIEYVNFKEEYESQ